jgi:hypothetical protein
MGIRMMMMMVLTILLIVPIIMAKGNYDPYTHSSSLLDDDQQIQHQYFHGDDVDAISNWEKLEKKKEETKKVRGKMQKPFPFWDESIRDMHRRLRNTKNGTDQKEVRGTMQPSQL